MMNCLQFQQPLWKSYLYQLQKEAPKAAAVFSLERVEDAPLQYGMEYHGLLHRKKCQDLLINDGSYLIRKNEESGDYWTLSLRFNGTIKFYKLYYDGKEHYVGEKKFNNLDDLITDGLVTLYLELKASKVLLQLSTVNYRQSPYFTLNRSVRRALNKTRPKSFIAPEKQSSACNNLSRTPDQVLKDTKSSVSIPVEHLNIKVESSSSILPEQRNALSSNESLNRSDSIEDLENDRPHRFLGQSFTGLHWCGFCGNFLWGLVLQGVKCQDCGLKAHRPCSLKVPNDCCPDLKNLTCLFGSDLSTGLTGIQREESVHVPPLVTECIAEIEARGLTVEGLYRVPGSHDQIDALRLAFERDGSNVSLQERSVADINVVAGLLKLYLRLLPLRLVTAECFQKLTEANKINVPEGRISIVKEALSLLPIAHFETLKAMIAHLSRVSEHSAINKMTATSLSTIFGPTLVQSETDETPLRPHELLALKLCAQEPRVIEMLLVLHKDVFS